MPHRCLSRPLLGLTATLLLTLGLCCAFGLLLVQQRVVALPLLDAQAGPYRLLAGVTDNPNCPFTVMPCSAPPPQPTQRYLTVWWITTVEHSGIVETSGRAVLRVSLDR